MTPRRWAASAASVVVIIVAQAMAAEPRAQSPPAFVQADAPPEDGSVATDWNAQL